MREVRAFSCIVERIVCPATGRARLKLTQAVPVGSFWLAVLRRLKGLFGYRRPSDVPAADIVFAVDADRGALVTMLQPWRKYVDATGEGAIRIAFMDEKEAGTRLGPDFSL